MQAEVQCARALAAAKNKDDGAIACEAESRESLLPDAGSGYKVAPYRIAGDVYLFSRKILFHSPKSNTDGANPR